MFEYSNKRRLLRCETDDVLKRFGVLIGRLYRPHACHGRSLTKPLAKGIYRVGTPAREHFDASIGEVLGPSTHAKAPRLGLGGSAIENALDTS